MAVRSSLAAWARRLVGARRRQPAVVDAVPPPCPSGWHVGPPDFVGVGAQRAGTTWWFGELAAHPDIHHAPGAPKEVHFFDGCAGRTLGPDDIARYHRWFPRPDGGMAGEWTPCYMYHPWELPLLAQAAPHTRVLVLLRDPVARFRSGFRFRSERGWAPEDAVVDAFQRGLYAHQVASLLAAFPRSQVLALTYEEARDSPDATLRRTVEFLGLDPERLPGSVTVRAARGASAGRSSVDDLVSGLHDELVTRYASDLASLADLLPDLDLGRWSVLASRG